jgi:large conductance mechanosensitive channel
MKTIRSLKSIKANKHVSHFNRFFSEFRQFSIQGNAIDLAIGVIIGAGFKTIVDSIVNDVLKPIISLVTTMLMQREKYGFSSYYAWKTLNTSISNFTSALINFLIVALCIFFIVKVMNKLHKKEAKPKELAPTSTELLLVEIRDLLKEEKSHSDLPNQL